MKTKILIACLMVIGFLASCSDVDIPSTPYADKAGNLTYTINDDGRGLTLYWDNPSKEDIQNILVYANSELKAELDPTATSYVIKKATPKADVMYTVKVKYADGRVSEGISVSARVDYDPTVVTTNVAMLVPEDYEDSGDEKAAVEWFQDTYVAAGKGIVITPAQIDKLNIEDYSACWVMCDRVGIERGWQNLPGGLASDETIEALKAYGYVGGNLFLTNHATQLTVAVGRIPDNYAPGIFGNGAGGDNPDTWGVHPVIGNIDGQIYDHRDHAIYEGMTYQPDLYAGIYTFEGAGVKGDHNCMWDLNAFGLAPNPNVVKAWEETTNSTVLGTWNHVVDYCCAGIVDFEPTADFAGRIVAIGLAAYEWDLGGGTNSYQSQIEMLTNNCLTYVATSTNEKMVAMLVADDYENSDDEKAAVAWFQQNYVNTGEGVILTASEADKLTPAFFSMCWVMCDRVGIEVGWNKLPGNLNNEDNVAALAKYAKAGGNLFLANHATQLTVAVGRIPDNYAPGIFGNGAGGENPDAWGCNAIIGYNGTNQYDRTSHPIFNEVTSEERDDNGTVHPYFPLISSGIKGDHNCMWDLNSFGLAPNPDVVKAWEEATNSTVLGTWQQVLDYCCAGIIDFEPTVNFAGRIVAIGLAAYEWDLGGGTNSYQSQIEKLTKSTINYLK